MICQLDCRLHKLSCKIKLDGAWYNRSVTVQAELISYRLPLSIILDCTISSSRSKRTAISNVQARHCKLDYSPASVNPACQFYDCILHSCKLLVTQLLHCYYIHDRWLSCVVRRPHTSRAHLISHNVAHHGSLRSWKNQQHHASPFHPSPHALLKLEINRN